MSVNWTTGRIVEADGYTEFALLPDDDTGGIRLGDMAEVKLAYAALGRLIESGRADEEIDSLHPQLSLWLSIKQASDKYNLPYTTIYSALQRGEIDRATQDDGQWFFPNNSILKWMANRPKLGRPASSE